MHQILDSIGDHHRTCAALATPPGAPTVTSRRAGAAPIAVSRDAMAGRAAIVEAPSAEDARTVVRPASADRA